jgi:hypothetical protein
VNDQRDIAAHQLGDRGHCDMSRFMRSHIFTWPAAIVICGVATQKQQHMLTGIAVPNLSPIAPNGSQTGHPGRWLEKKSPNGQSPGGGWQSRRTAGTFPLPIVEGR